MIEAATLEGHDGGQIAVTLREATTTETFRLLSRAYALSERERQVVAALVAGLDTRAIAQRLFISRYTVQDHLKSVYEKVGVSSRGELVAKMFADHYHDGLTGAIHGAATAPATALAAAA